MAGEGCCSVHRRIGGITESTETLEEKISISCDTRLLRTPGMFLIAVELQGNTDNFPDKSHRW